MLALHRGQLPSIEKKPRVQIPGHALTIVSVLRVITMWRIAQQLDLVALTDLKEASKRT
jgi:hypothetical protein